MKKFFEKNYVDKNPGAKDLKGRRSYHFRQRELVQTVTEVKQRKVVGILRDGRIATLKKFLAKVPGDKVK